jgi:hypothetical protein
MPTLFSYVVHHDFGLSPNPSGGFCTLAFCKFRRADGMPNVVELARVGDWIAGTGGKSKLSAGHGKLVYAMKVTETMVLREYFRDPRFRVRGGNVEEWAQESEMYALVSDHFWYFGAEAPKLRHAIEKRGPGFRNKFDADLVRSFVEWLEDGWEVGIHGYPCAEHEDANWVGREGPDGLFTDRRECRGSDSRSKPKVCYRPRRRGTRSSYPS